MMPILKRYFSAQQLREIETAFEVDAQRFKGSKRAESFGRSCSTNGKRMTAIMQNIIDNDGEFRP